MDIPGHKSLFDSWTIRTHWEEAINPAYENLHKARLEVFHAERKRLLLYLTDLRQHFPFITAVEFEGSICYDDREPFNEVMLVLVGWPEDKDEDIRSEIEGDLSEFDVQHWAQDPEAGAYTCGSVNLTTLQVTLEEPTNIEDKDL